MRIWSLHPKYLDAKGLVALWREALLAKHVLEGKTKGYTNHPQLYRFKKLSKPVEAINRYLQEVCAEAIARGYNFDASKIGPTGRSKIKVTSGQLEYETKHLLNKLKIRDPKKWEEFKKESIIDLHPIFILIDGEIEEWEKV
ncbi:MAG TPA: pyrimidine dimer DNA glycosylase/endonuclease V [Candidatus Kapabacteria bacterium]|nr:pyrimidine dimer DNA glycosylase/endonuclease V [Candidatus Kapabacteria bacterium]